MSNNISSDKWLQLIDCVKQKKSIRQIAKECRIAKNTVARHLRLLFPNGRNQFCDCGKLITHREWCEFRISKSDSRQKFLKRITYPIITNPFQCPKCKSTMYKNTEITPFMILESISCKICGFYGPLITKPKTIIK